VTGQYVVILTGGLLPDGRPPVDSDPPRAHLDLAIERGTGKDGNPVLRHIAEEAWELGFKEAATLHRTVGVWVVGSDEDEAKRFAEFVTREIDPAYVTKARSPLGEMLNAADEERRRLWAPDGAS
jgi:hypothetical protein